jgi:hypothetical protein
VGAQRNPQKRALHQRREKVARNRKNQPKNLLLPRKERLNLNPNLKKKVKRRAKKYYK